MRRLLGGAAILLALTATGVQAQAAKGIWDVEYVRGVRRSNDGEEVFKGKARLVIAEVKGDSVFGTWTVLDPESPPRELRGTVTGNTVKLALAPATSTVNVNGQQQEVTTTATLDGTLAGDTIKGNMTTEGLPGRMVLPREWSAIRLK